MLMIMGGYFWYFFEINELIYCPYTRCINIENKNMSITAE